ncbi:MAG: hypothetical protein P8181_12820, partial [bacterium]
MIVNRRFIWLVLLGAPLWLIQLAVPFGWVFAAAYLLALSGFAIVQYRNLPDQAQIEVERRLPKRFSLDSTQTVAIDITNRSRVSVRVELREEVPYALTLGTSFEPFTLPPGRTARIPYDVKSIERGVHHFGDTVVRVSTDGSLVKRQLRLGRHDTAKVYPEFLGVDQYELVAEMDR